MTSPTFEPADERLDPVLVVLYNEMRDEQRAADGLGLLVAVLERARPAWHAEAACRSSDLDFTSRSPSIRSKAVQACGTCTVRSQCLAWALEVGDNVSVLGGMDPPARARLARAPRDGVAVVTLVSRIRRKTGQSPTSI